MPHDLFGDAVIRPPARSRLRRLLPAISVAAHAVAIVAVLAAQLLAVGPLPSVHHPLEFDYVLVAAAPEIPPPPAPRRAPPGDATRLAHASDAPIEPPHGITAETGLESGVAAAPGVDIGGVEGGSGTIDSTRFADVGGPPPPPEAPQRPIRLHAGIQPPRKITDAMPIYPSIAQAAHVQGIVILEAVINAHGTVTSVHVLRSVPLLDQAAVDAVRQWRYTPALLNGEAVPVVMTVTVQFSLER